MNKNWVVSISLGAFLVSSIYAETFTMVDGGNETRVVDGWVNDVIDSSLYVGKTTSGNALHILNGGKVYDAAAYIGDAWQTTSSGNSAWVAGSGSVWSNTFYFYVGYNASSGNQLTIELEGRVYSGSKSGLGVNSHNNSVVVRDSGSVWEAKSILDIGMRGNNNSLSIQNGGRVSAVGYYGVIIGSSGLDNECIISGAGSELSVGGILALGYSGSTLSSGNRLLIQDGGEAICSEGIVGDGGGSSWANDNTLTVSGSNSAWAISGPLYVGRKRASGNRLLIENGARVSSMNAYIGTGQSSTTNNHVIVTGSGSEWMNLGEIFVGEQYGEEDGANNALYIEESAAVFAKAVTVNSGWTPWNSRMVISDGFLSAEQITIKSYRNYIALTNAVLRWTSQTNGTPFMTLGGSEQLDGTNKIQIAVGSRSAMENVSLDLMSGLGNPADTNLFEVLFLDTAADHLYRPEGAIYTFETNSATWSIATDGNTEFIPTPPVPILSIDISGDEVNIDAQYLPEETTLYLQASTNLVSGSWSNLYETSGTASTNWNLPLPSASNIYYRIHSN